MPSSRKPAIVIKRQQLDMQPLRTLGEHTVRIRLTMDLIPEIKVTVYREGEAEPSLPIEEPADKPEENTAGRVCTRRDFRTRRGLISQREPITYHHRSNLQGKPVMFRYYHARDHRSTTQSSP